MIPIVQMTTIPLPISSIGNSPYQINYVNEFQLTSKSTPAKTPIATMKSMDQQALITAANALADQQD